LLLAFHFKKLHWARVLVFELRQGHGNDLRHHIVEARAKNALFAGPAPVPLLLPWTPRNGLNQAAPVFVTAS